MWNKKLEKCEKAFVELSKIYMKVCMENEELKATVEELKNPEEK